MPHDPPSSPPPLLPESTACDLLPSSNECLRRSLEVQGPRTSSLFSSLALPLLNEAKCPDLSLGMF